MKMTTDLMDNLMELQRKCLVNFDIKPDNIFYLSVSDEFVICDQGLTEKIDIERGQYESDTLI